MIASWCRTCQGLLPAQQNWQREEPLWCPSAAGRGGAADLVDELQVACHAPQRLGIRAGLPEEHGEVIAAAGQALGPASTCCLPPAQRSGFNFVGASRLCSAAQLAIVFGICGGGGGGGAAGRRPGMQALLLAVSQAGSLHSPDACLPLACPAERCSSQTGATASSASAGATRCAQVSPVAACAACSIVSQHVQHPLLAARTCPAQPAGPQRGPWAPCRDGQRAPCAARALWTTPGCSPNAHGPSARAQGAHPAHMARHGGALGTGARLGPHAGACASPDSPCWLLGQCGFCAMLGVHEATVAGPDSDRLQERGLGTVVQGRLAQAVGCLQAAEAGISPQHPRR